MNRLSCYPKCRIDLPHSGTKLVTTSVSVPCPGVQRQHNSVEFIVHIDFPPRQRSVFKLQPAYPNQPESRTIGSEAYLADLTVQFHEKLDDDFVVKACITPPDTHQICFMDQIISKQEAYEASCSNARESGGVSLLFMSALLVFACLLIGMAATVFIYRMYRRFKERRPHREPIHCDPSKLTSPPRPFHAQLTVVMEEEEDRCSPSTPIKDLLWRSSSPTPSNTPKGTISMPRNSPILSSILP
ncbi:hypothetical protein PFISCL1PPCAC_18676, partial [Pristionchus fissidentatus]